MADSHCSKCGKELVEGKRFCGGCGQPAPVPTIPTPLEPSVGIKPAAPSCAKCGIALVPGKHFCTQCGHSVDGPAPVATETPSAASEIAPEPTDHVCEQCGSALIPGKRFCKKCGHAVDAPVFMAPATGIPAGQQRSSKTETGALDLLSAVPVSEPMDLPAAANSEPPPIPATVSAAVEPDLTFNQEEIPATAWTSPIESMEQKVPVPPVGKLPIGSDISPSARNSRSFQKAGFVIGIVAAVLAAVGVWAWYVHAHRSVTSVARVPTESQLVPATQVEQPSKPSPSIPASTASGPQHSKTLPVAVPTLVVQAKQFPVDSAQQLVKVTPTPETVLPPPLLQVPPTPAVPLSGALHYQGPPVPYNGTVVFDHLPHARLKFSFDREAWTLTIKPNPDGTKRVTLISQKQGYQENCDLGWEIVE